MRLSLPQHRANRIPRLAPSRPSLYRRLHNWAKRLQLQSELRRLTAERDELRHGMAIDAAAMAAHRLHYTKSPVLQARVRQDQAAMLELECKLAELAAQLRALGAAS